MQDQLPLLYFNLCPIHTKFHEQCLNFYAAVDPIAHSRECRTRDYANDNLLKQNMDTTPEQVANMWLSFDHEFESWGTEYHIHDIRNSTDKEHDRLPIYKENLADLKNGQWLGNIIIYFFSWKLFDMLDKIGIKDVHKCFKITDSGLCTTCTYLTNNIMPMHIVDGWQRRK
jgi:hypothetical protein